VQLQIFQRIKHKSRSENREKGKKKLYTGSLFLKSYIDLVFFANLQRIPLTQIKLYTLYN